MAYIGSRVHSRTCCRGIDKAGFRGRSQKKDKGLGKPERVLIYRLGSLGDTVVALPSLHLVARAFPGAERRILTNIPVNGRAAPIQSILEGTGLAHGYFRYPLSTRSGRILKELRAEISAWKPDVLVYLAAPRGPSKAIRDALFFAACGIPRIIGLPLSNERQRRRFDPATGLYESEASRLARCLSAVGDARLENRDSWDLHLSHEMNAAEGLLQEIDEASPLIACCPGTKCDSKDWGAANWRCLLERLSDIFPGAGMIFLGAPGERELCDSVSGAWAGRSLNLCGLVSPRESAAIIKVSALLIGHDSGPLHLAAAVGAPSVSIFSARNRPGEWFPFGYPRNHKVVYHKTDCYGCGLEDCTVHRKKCIASITVDEVLDSVLALMGSLSSSHARAQSFLAASTAAG